MIARGIEAKGRTVARAELDGVFRRFHRSLFRAYRGPLAAFSRIDRCARRTAANGWRFAVCTNKLEYLSVFLLKQLGSPTASR